VEDLIRRRKAEVQHVLSLAAEVPHPHPEPQAQASTPIQLLQPVIHFWDLPHQRRAWELQQESLSPEQRQAFALACRQAPPPATAGSALLELAVPYLSQNDSATAEGARMCFSSTCAMAASFLRPGCLQGAGQMDDRYLALAQLGRGIPVPVGWLHRGPVDAPPAAASGAW
jgi:hypothetical protein